MKNLVAYILITAGIILQGCDKIDAPYGESGGVAPVPTDSVVQKVLLEDFTGFHCTNCPDAHRLAKQLKALYKDRLIILGEHVGIFAQPNIWGPMYTYDFRTQTATDIYGAFANNLPLPIGYVNRKAYQGTIPLYSGSWASAIAAELAKAPKAGIEFDTIHFDDATRVISGEVTVKFQTSVPEELNICFYTVEDSIVQPQLDNGVDIPQYDHLHVLRGSLNTTWGESIGSAHDSGSEVTVNFSGTYTPNDANPAHSFIYAILIDKTTKEVVQVEEMRMK